jgi:beta-N-acetylhexosaminidase
MAPCAAVFGPAGTEITDWERGFFAEARPLGFILFARNCDTPDQLRRLTDDLRTAAGHDALVLIDQEGGRVQRLRPPHWRAWRPPLEDAARASNPARAMALRYRIIGHELRSLGIDVNAVPCADLARPETHAFLRNRCYGETVADVTRIARAVAEGCLAGGVLPVLKHLPGHGRAQADSHLQLPRVAAPTAALAATDFAPFRALSDLPLGMTAHVVYAGLGQSAPATQAPDMIRLIRNELGFGGLLMTDDIGMEALAGPVGARATAALAAGCDVVLHCNGARAEIAEVARACGPLTGPAEARARAALAARPAAAPVDIAALVAEFESLVGQGPGRGGR